MSAAVIQLNVVEWWPAKYSKNAQHFVQSISFSFCKVYSCSLALNVVLHILLDIILCFSRRKNTKNTR